MTSGYEIRRRPNAKQREPRILPRNAIVSMGLVSWAEPARNAGAPSAPPRYTGMDQFLRGRLL